MNLATVCLFVCASFALVESVNRYDACTKATRRCLKHLEGSRVQKVCGTDDVTYKSICLLEQRACKTGEVVRMAYQGGCSSNQRRQQTPNRVILPMPRPTERQPEVSAGGGRGGTGARGAGGDNSNESGSDESGSSEERERSEGNPRTATERIRYDRVTIPPRTTSFSTTSSPSVTSELALPAECPETCPIVDRPVCGSDGSTYDSPCLLKSESCRLERADLVPVYAGACVPVCGGECEALYDPVCGTNGVTYMSRCTLDQTACRTTDATLTVAYKGECFHSLRERGCQQECEDIIVPVCTNNGMTYKNRCEFERYQCVTTDHFAFIATEGACPGTSLECYEDCPDIPFPVCASNNVTYPSICEYSIANCKDSNVTFAYSGPCVISTPNPCEVECSLHLAPVCATNAASYFNRCFLNLAACQDPTINYVRDGKCDMTS